MGDNSKKVPLIVRSKMKTIIFIFMIVCLISINFYQRAEAASRPGVTRTIGGKTVKTIKSVGNGIYKVGEFFVVELFRPIKALTDKAVELWGVPVKG